MSSNVVFRKNGGFYSVYGDDCYILYYLFKYRIIDDRVGFPISAYNKVVNALNENLINHEYNDDVVNYKKKNNYDKFVKLGKKKYNLDFRIKDIISKLDKLNEKDIDKILDYIEEFL